MHISLFWLGIVFIATAVVCFCITFPSIARYRTMLWVIPITIAGLVLLNLHGEVELLLLFFIGVVCFIASFVAMITSAKPETQIANLHIGIVWMQTTVFTVLTLLAMLVQYLGHYKIVHK